MKKYIIFVDGFGDYHAQCDTIEEANQYKEEILKGKEKQLTDWQKELELLENINKKNNSDMVTRMIYDVKSKILDIENTIKGAKDNTHIYEIIK
jgi:vacuolar-type H+-ATPase subunit E/Vma4